MALTTAKLTAAPAPTIVDLDHHPKLREKWQANLRTFRDATEEKRQLNTRITELDNILGPLKDELIDLLVSEELDKDGNNILLAGICGSAVIGLKRTAASPATLSRKEGKGNKIPLSAVTSYLVGNTAVPGDDIAGCYGGRAVSYSITISGVLDPAPEEE